ncbi:TonB-dependent receptor plug domain-containing protein [Longimicrobium sp.]|uniref:TonB-dependent receptor plug domain-containing protein n=1 Tax=Longimicrobium sp. TaxID=2029185 RepID=UPI002C2CD2FE|nr:TonB-dependent receptor plug domain-containing protein [Longimicrobium sp.]HSU17198.1 TonB-dependent receptor plug domain-containing protein [Longimicrobium sp.]
MATPSRLVRGAAMALALWALACRGPRPGDPAPEPVEPYPPGPVATGHAQVDGDEARDARVVRAEELLRGRVAGVQVTVLPTGGISVRIRGRTSLSASEEPLYVVDGSTVHAEPGGALTWLDPHDIDRIEVLKDPGETAFYGVRGANGVILITTRH